MKLTDIWKQRVVECLETMYGKDGLQYDVINTYLDDKIKKASVDNVQLYLRNIYEGYNQKILANDIMNIVDEKQLIIGANGSFAYNQSDRMSPVSLELIKLKKLRKEFKEKALNTTDPEEQRYYENIQIKVKENTNSFYGIQLLSGSFLYNPDTASYITLQGQELISEMMWTFERFLEDNPQFYSFNDFFLFVDNTIRRTVDINSIKEYITYIPSTRDVLHRLLELSSTLPNVSQRINNKKYSLFVSATKLNEQQRIQLYYANNLKALIKNNPKIIAMFRNIVKDPEPFYTYSELTEEEKKKNIKPTLILNKHYTTMLDFLSNIIIPLVYIPVTNYKRVYKYVNKRRKSVILSDTDSVMINLGHWFDRINQWAQLNIDDFNDMEHAIKIVNSFVYIVTKVSQYAATLYCTQCHVPQNYHNLIEMKNEFLFKRMIIYSNSKKSYAAHIILREGREMDDMEWKGLKLTGSASSPIVQKMVRDFVEKNILKSPHVNPYELLKILKSYEDIIKNMVYEGELSLGRPTRFSESKYKNIYTNAGGRSCLIWNLLYPNNPINDGDYGYMFTIYPINKENYIKISDPIIRERIIKNVFENSKYPELANYDINYISIPKNNDVQRIPDWIIPFINMEDLINIHLQPLISLLPSLGLYRSRINSTTYTYSPIISF